MQFWAEKLKPEAITIVLVHECFIWIFLSIFVDFDRLVIQSIGKFYHRFYEQ